MYELTYVRITVPYVLLSSLSVLYPQYVPLVCVHSCNAQRVLPALWSGMKGKNRLIFILPLIPSLLQGFLQ